MKIGIIQWSLNQDGNTPKAINFFQEKADKFNIQQEIINLQNIDLEFCNWQPPEKYNKNLQETFEKINSCNWYIIWMPVYQYSVSWPLKNFLDLSSKFMFWKPFGILEVSWSIRSYLAAWDLMNLLFFECEMVPIPPVIHLSINDFKEDYYKYDDNINSKIEQLTNNIQKHL